jgi:uncharacterized protein (DUF934 family)
MRVLVTDDGFAPDDWNDGYVPLAAISDDTVRGFALGVDLKTPELTPHEWERLGTVLSRAGLVRICVRNFGDLDAYALATALRSKGYMGRLRAHGAMLARCYTLARRAGFDEVELALDQARLQPRELWRNVPGWKPSGPSGFPSISGAF